MVNSQNPIHPQEGNPLLRITLPLGSRGDMSAQLLLQPAIWVLARCYGSVNPSGSQEVRECAHCRECSDELWGQLSLQEAGAVELTDKTAVPPLILWTSGPHIPSTSSSSCTWSISASAVVVHDGRTEARYSMTYHFSKILALLLVPPSESFTALQRDIRELRVSVYYLDQL
jgi:hypothetical protein